MFNMNIPEYVTSCDLGYLLIFALKICLDPIFFMALVAHVVIDCVIIM